MLKNKLGRRRKGSSLKELLLLLALKLEGPIGRYRLKDILDLSEHEGIVRLMLSRLQSNGSISTSKIGCSLKKKGFSHLRDLLKNYCILDVKHLDVGSLTKAPHNAVAHIKAGANKAVSIVRHRDAAVRVGAEGATIVFFNNGILTVPNVYEDLLTTYPEIANLLIQSFHPEDGDAFIIGFSNNKWKALEGALAASISLQNNFR